MKPTTKYEPIDYIAIETHARQLRGEALASGVRAMARGLRGLFSMRVGRGLGRGVGRGGRTA